MKRIMRVLLWIMVLFLLSGCNEINKEIKIYEKNIEEILLLDNPTEKMSKIFEMKQKLKKCSEEIMNNIKNIDDLETDSLYSFNAYKRSLEYGNYLSKTKDYYEIKQLIELDNLSELIVHKDNMNIDNIIQDNSFIEYFKDIVNIPYINIIKDEDNQIYDYMNKQSINTYKVFIDSEEKNIINIYSNGHIVINVESEKEIRTFVSLMKIDFNLLSDNYNEVEKEEITTIINRIEIYTKDVEYIETIRLQKIINKFIKAFEDKEVKELYQIYLGADEQEHKFLQEYLDELDIMKEALRLYLYLSDGSIIKLYYSKDDRVYYFSNEFVLYIVSLDRDN